VAVRGSPQGGQPHRRHRTGQGIRAVRDRLRAVGPAAYRHVRRGRAHDHGAPGVPAPERRAGRGCSASPTTWTGCARCPTTCPTRRCWRSISASRSPRCPTRSATSIPSFGAANNARLRAFLDSFGFEYEFQSATEWYKSGRFDKMLLDHAAPLRRGAGGDAADPRRGAAGDLLDLPADLAQDRARAAGAGDPDKRRCRAPSSIATRTAR
jgi:hypothetical protein